MGECPWQLTNPGISRPPRRRTSVPGRRRDLPGIADPRNHTVVDLDRARREHGVGGVDGEDGVGLQPHGHGAPTYNRSERSLETVHRLVAAFHHDLHVAVGITIAHPGHGARNEASLVEQGERAEVQFDLLADPEEANALPRVHLGPRHHQRE